MKVILAGLIVVAGASALFFATPRHSDISYSSHSPIEIKQEEARWKVRILEVGGTQAYEELGQAMQDLTPGEQHELAHAFGGALYAAEGERGADVCDTRYLYGCWHEYLGRFVAEEGVAGISKVYGACQESTKRSGTSACIHAFGHGLVAHYGYTMQGLKKAIDVCEKASGQYAQECLNGAFMEYQIRFLTDATVYAVRPLPASGDLYDPCDQFPVRYGPRCVENLPIWWYTHFFDTTSDATTTADRFKELGRRCQTLPQALKATESNCYYGIGLTVSYAGIDTKEYEIECARAAHDEKDRLICLSVAGADMGVHVGSPGAGTDACASFSGATKTVCEAYARGSPWDTSRTLPEL